MRLEDLRGPKIVEEREERGCEGGRGEGKVESADFKRKERVFSIEQSADGMRHCSSGCACIRICLRTYQVISRFH